MRMPAKRAGITVLAIGMATSVASLTPMWTTSSGAAAKGSNPGAKICTYTKAQQASSTKLTTTLEKDLVSGNWAATKAALLATFANNSKIEQEAAAAYSGAPANVKATEPVVIQLVKTEENLVKSSTSATQFESSFTTAIESPKFLAAEKIEANYYHSVCGGTTP